MHNLFDVADSRKRPVWSEPYHEDVKTEIVHETQLQGHKVEVYKTTVTTHKLRVYPAATNGPAATNDHKPGRS